MVRMQLRDGAAPENQTRCRCWERQVLAHQATITVRLAGRIHHGHVADLSLDGAKLVFDDDVPCQDELVFEHRTAGAFTGRCVWQDGQAIGLQFDVPKSRLDHAAQCTSLRRHPD